MLGLIMQAYPNVNAVWLLTGQGPPLLDDKYFAERKKEKEAKEPVALTAAEQAAMAYHLAVIRAEVPDIDSLLSTNFAVPIDAGKNAGFDAGFAKKKAAEAPVLAYGRQISTMEPQGRPIPTFDIKAAAGNALIAPDHEQDVGSIYLEAILGRDTSNTYCIQITGDSMAPTIYDHDWVVCTRINSPDEIRDGNIYVVVTQEGVCCKRVLNRVKERQALALQSDNPTYKTYQEKITDVLALFRVRFKISSNLRNEGADVLKDVSKLKDDFESVMAILRKAGIKID